jgi:hypothetical protein
MSSATVSEQGSYKISEKPTVSRGTHAAGLAGSKVDELLGTHEPLVASGN